MTSCELAPNLLTHLEHGRSPVCCFLKAQFLSDRVLTELVRPAMRPATQLRCKVHPWSLSICRQGLHGPCDLSEGGTPITGSSRQCLRAPTGSRGMHCGSSASRPSGGEAPHRRCSTGHQAQFWRSASQAMLHWPPGSVEAKRLTGDVPLAARLSGGEAPHRRRSTGHHAQWAETPDRRCFAGHQAQWGETPHRRCSHGETTCSRLCAVCTALSLPAPAPQSSRAISPHRDDMIKAVCRLHCLVLVGASSTDQLGHLQVPASRRHDRGCVPFALPCPCRRQLHRAVGPPSGARIQTT